MDKDVLNPKNTFLLIDYHLKLKEKEINYNKESDKNEIETYIVFQIFSPLHFLNFNMNEIGIIILYYKSQEIYLKKKKN